MKKFVCFLMVGFAFAALQLSTVSAQTEMPPMGNTSGMPPMGNQEMPPGTAGMPPMGNQEMPPMGDPCMNIPNGPDKDACYAGMKGEHHDGPQGEHHDGPPIDPRSGQPFTQADGAKFQKYDDECKATKGRLSQGSADELVKEGFTRIQVEDLCKMSADQGEHHDGPPMGNQGMPPMGNTSGMPPMGMNSGMPGMHGGPNGAGPGGPGGMPVMPPGMPGGPGGPGGFVPPPMPPEVERCSKMPPGPDQSRCFDELPCDLGGPPPGMGLEEHLRRVGECESMKMERKGGMPGGMPGGQDGNPRP